MLDTKHLHNYARRTTRNFYRSKWLPQQQNSLHDHYKLNKYLTKCKLETTQCESKQIISRQIEQFFFSIFATVFYQPGFSDFFVKIISILDFCQIKKNRCRAKKKFAGHSSKAATRLQICWPHENYCKSHFSDCARKKKNKPNQLFVIRVSTNSTQKWMMNSLCAGTIFRFVAF